MRFGMKNEGVLTKRIANASAAQFAAAVESSVVDMKHYAFARFVALIGAIAATGTAVVKLMGCDTSGGTYVDIAGSAITYGATDDNKLAIIELIHHKQEHRFVKMVVTPATASVTIDGMFADLCNGRTAPVDNDATVMGWKYLPSPETGTP